MCAFCIGKYLLLSAYADCYQLALFPAFSMDYRPPPLCFGEEVKNERFCSSKNMVSPKIQFCGHMRAAEHEGCGRAQLHRNLAVNR